MTKKKAFIIYGWGGSPNESIHKWLKRELEINGFLVSILEMPNTNEPKIEEWVNYLDEKVGKLDKDTYFVGHSIGCQTIMRYLEVQKERVGGIVFIAGWFNLVDMEDEEEERIAKPWIETPIKFDKIKKNSKSITVFISSNEPYGYVKENTNIFRDKLGAKVIIENNRGHFTEEDGVTEMPEVISEILEMAGGNEEA